MALTPGTWTDCRDLFGASVFLALEAVAENGLTPVAQSADRQLVLVAGHPLDRPDEAA
jgi:hypothetical protein